MHRAGADPGGRPERLRQQGKKAGQALASVNGEEITVLQLNEELQRAGVQAAQQEEASKQLLEALIDRQLLQNEAQKEKIDRDPKVQQAIERAKALIVAQAYMQKRVGNIARPSKEEVEAYFKQHPEFFANRKAFDLRQLVIASEDMNDELKAAMDQAKSLEEVAVWMESHKVKYARAQVVRSSADLPPELSGKLLAMPKGQLFIIREGARTMLMAIADTKEAPVTLEVASQQIEQFLFNKKNKEAADAEVKRLRTSAKIEYLGKQKAPAAAPAASATAAAPAAPLAAPSAAEGAASADPLGGSAERGVAGLK
ncbi:EpsD family peptidyl-prolyl cis-trans isomerase [Massilia sp. MB5]|uniref:EpsD family peptidyl-prolyl cis-trans isomerase n=1 Tax=Massilia sp. MB5 TaxID=2919578 RepID=UPI001F0F7097|nr:EpsD family peptidyl-prolyl cis-trans isomerase [Massilia sp. MB5]UMR28350.1 EpsD family peptidyl-prolyl cis-trans isomerase [Massilia sp. MB5]